MKKIILPVSVCIILFAGCSGPGASPSIKTADVDAGHSVTATGHFSVTLDGVQITGNGIDEMQLQNTAFIYPDNKMGKKIIFYLYSKKNANDDSVNYSMRFDLPDKTGVFHHVSGDEEHLYLMLNTGLQTNSMARYSGDEITVNITALTATRITGTFSGIFRLGPDTPRADKKQLTITDGSFDIPFSTGTLRPE